MNEEKMRLFISDDLREIRNKQIKPRYKETWSDAWAIGPKYGDSEWCPVCGRHVSGLRWMEPRRMRLHKSKVS